MCDRFTQMTWGELVALYRLTQPVRNLKPRYNVAPTTAVHVVFLHGKRNLELVPMQWGCVRRGGKRRSRNCRQRSTHGPRRSRASRCSALSSCGRAALSPYRDTTNGRRRPRARSRSTSALPMAACSLPRNHDCVFDTVFRVKRALDARAVQPLPAPPGGRGRWQSEDHFRTDSPRRPRRIRRLPLRRRHTDCETKSRPDV